ncbi:hypothetical protein M2132_001247 [Dysgonomonas sp. PH5-45]|uniref:hypothetical protein n=1 Tax=unclassified Dysgonomonas TaxID=2630389 RepID=UPI002473A0AD|nr:MULTISPECIES: hypothetical protein [unclassified Dysgonomonas]MDH6354912.1 hypothetical protein [Dysgonomonas sp. PH5-45]MDH6387811.1 hypothetical protein [Dysgonomonas sp. PH5-37]
MSKIKLTGVKRQTKYSPNHIGNDGMIFNLTVESLLKFGYEVHDYTEPEFVFSDLNEDFIFNMARDVNTIKRLKRLEDAGSLVINSGYGIENCTRGRMTKILMDNHIPHPDSFIINTNEDPSSQLEEMNAGAFWVKRGDFHAIHREDVTFARNISEAKSIIKEFAFRNIPNAVVNEHLVGDLVKFYGVADTDYFFYFYPFDLSHSKFGLEKINGEAHQYSFSVKELKEACDKAGEVLGIKIYGGDCVVNRDGSFKIIDFNDWPSFAPCRDEAAPKIAECIHKQIIRKLNKE